MGGRFLNVILMRLYRVDNIVIYDKDPHMQQSIIGQQLDEALEKAKFNE